MYFRYGDPNWESTDAGTGAAAFPHSDRAGAATAAAAAQASPRLPRVVLRDVQIHAITEIDCVQHILSELDAGRGGMVVTPNLDHLHRCIHDLNFAALVSEAEIVVADGMPLVWATRLLGTPLPERVAGSNLISSLSRAAAAGGRKVFMLGGSPGTAERAAEVLRTQFPSLKVVGTLCPPFGFENDPRMMADLIQSVSEARPDIVFVALGSPKQERLILRLRPVLPHAWWLGVGISFSFLCGDVRRAPRWMQKVGLEWVHRLIQEPRRLFRRYIVVGVPFAVRLLGGSFVQGLPLRFEKRKGKNASPNLPGAASTAGPTGNPTPLAPPANGNGNGHSLAHGPASASQKSGVNGIARLTRSSEGLMIPPGLLQSGLGDGAAGGVPTRRPAAAGVTDAPRPASPLSRLRALVLLGGSVRPTALGLATRRSVLDLPLDENGSVLTGWLDQASELARSVGLEKLPVRVMVNHKSPEPASADPRHYGCFRVERDLSEYRGTGGVLRDLANDYADDDLIVVANAAQILLEPLPAIVAALDRAGGDVTVVSHEDGTPSGISLVTCKTLRLIAESGYVDMKEQALPQIAERFDVRVLARRRPTALPIRTLEDYIHALRYHHRRKPGAKPAGQTPGAAALDPLAEDWSPLFSLVEPGATVDPSARVHDSVVLDGGVVEAGAVLVRSVVCPGGVLRRDKTAMETFVTADDSPSRPSRRRDKRREGRIRGTAKGLAMAAGTGAAVPALAGATIATATPAKIVS